MKNTYDVIIAGAGPVGLFLACELGLSGVSVLLLERDHSHSTILKMKPLGNRGLNIPSIEALYRRGLLGNALENEQERPAYFEKNPEFQFAGHFAGIILDANKLDLTRWKYRLNGPSLLPGITNLEKLCTTLSNRAKNLGVTILTDQEIKNVNQDDSQVTVESNEKIYYAKWLVGCDGGRSHIRKSFGFEFIGTEPTFTAYSVLCELKDQYKLQKGFQSTQYGMYIYAWEGNIHVVDFDNGAFDRSKELTLEHFQSVLRRITETDVTVEKINFATTYTDRAMQVTTYRKGRVLLAGDSAHIHSPLGAQGLNAGIGDAINLGWKLAATIKGQASESLLDTYTQERHPIGAWVLEWTRAQVTTLQPNQFGAATRKVIKDLLATDDGTNYFIDRVWGLSLRYDLNDEHILVGSSCPDFELSDETRLGPKMSSGKAILIDFENNSALENLAKSWKGRIDYLSLKVKDTLGLKSLIVRPDGIVAWVAEKDIDLKKATTTLTYWLGDLQ